MRTPAARAAMLTTGAAVAAVALAGCGAGGSDTAAQPLVPSTTTVSPSPSSSAPSSSSSSSPAPSTSDTAPPSQPNGEFCTAKELQLALGRGEGTAGTVYRPLTFTNVGSRTCVVQGYPGVSYVTGDSGTQVGPAAFRTGSKGPKITLTKGQSATSNVGLVNVRNYDAAACKPTPVRGLRVYPPQETESKFVQLDDSVGCAGDKIPGNQLTVATLTRGGGS